MLARVVPTKKEKRAHSSAGLEHLSYKQRVIGSNPIGPTLSQSRITLRADTRDFENLVARTREGSQLSWFRASVLQTEGHRFESYWAHAQREWWYGLEFENKVSLTTTKRKPLSFLMIKGGQWLFLQSSDHVLTILFLVFYRRTARDNNRRSKALHPRAPNIGQPR